MGAEKVTVTNLEIVTIDEKEGIIFIKGATPGAINSLTIIKGQGELKVNLKKEESVEKVESEEVKVEAEEKKEEVKVETEEKKEEVKTENKN